MYSNICIDHKYGILLILVLVLFLFGSDYFNENFQVKENKTKMRNIHPRFFYLLF